MYQHTKLPSYLPMPRFLMNLPISNTAKLLYTLFLGKAQLSQKMFGWIVKAECILSILSIK